MRSSFISKANSFLCDGFPRHSVSSEVTRIFADPHRSQSLDVSELQSSSSSLVMDTHVTETMLERATIHGAPTSVSSVGPCTAKASQLQTECAHGARSCVSDSTSGVQNIPYRFTDARQAGDAREKRRMAVRRFLLCSRSRCHKEGATDVHRRPFQTAVINWYLAMVTRSTSDGSQPGTHCRGSSRAAHFPSSFIQIFGIIQRRRESARDGGGA